MFYYRSDHYNFAKNNIPIIFYFNGVHEDYHKEGDEVNKITFPMLAKRAQLVFLTAWELANRPNRIVVDKKNDKTLLKLFTIMRNARISAAVGIQDLTIMSSINRGNINYVILMRLNSELAIEKVIRSYLRSYFPHRTSMVECVRLYKEMTEDRQFFVVDNINGRVYHSKLSL